MAKKRLVSCESAQNSRQKFEGGVINGAVLKRSRTYYDFLVRGRFCTRASACRANQPNEGSNTARLVLEPNLHPSK